MWMETEGGDTRKMKALMKTKKRCVDADCVKPLFQIGDADGRGTQRPNVFTFLISSTVMFVIQLRRSSGEKCLCIGLFASIFVC